MSIGFDGVYVSCFESVVLATAAPSEGCLKASAVELMIFVSVYGFVAAATFGSRNLYRLRFVVQLRPVLLAKVVPNIDSDLSIRVAMIVLLFRCHV